jgi:hypothetical protein
MYSFSCTDELSTFVFFAYAMPSKYTLLSLSYLHGCRPSGVQNGTDLAILEGLLAALHRFLIPVAKIMNVCTSVKRSEGKYGKRFLRQVFDVTS